MQDNQLADFQALLLDSLYEHEKAEDILCHLRSSDYHFEKWIQQMDPAMVEIGAELIKKWGRK